MAYTHPLKPPPPIFPFFIFFIPWCKKKKIWSSFFFFFCRLMVSPGGGPLPGGACVWGSCCPSPSCFECLDSLLHTRKVCNIFSFLMSFHLLTFSKTNRPLPLCDLCFPLLADEVEDLNFQPWSCTQHFNFYFARLFPRYMPCVHGQYSYM